MKKTSSTASSEYFNTSVCDLYGSFSDHSKEKLLKIPSLSKCIETNLLATLFLKYVKILF